MIFYRKFQKVLLLVFFSFMFCCILILQINFLTNENLVTSNCKHKNARDLLCTLEILFRDNDEDDCDLMKTCF